MSPQEPLTRWKAVASAKQETEYKEEGTQAVPGTIFFGTTVPLLLHVTVSTLLTVENGELLRYRRRFIEGAGGGDVYRFDTRLVFDLLDIGE